LRLNTNSLLFTQPPLWLQSRQGSRHQLPVNIQSWIYESGSLTRRLRSVYGNAVTVSVLLQKWQVPFLSERKRLHLPEHQYSLIREVLLHADGKPLILARTVIPAGTIKIARSNLSQLGTRPLGEVIFSCPKLERLSLDITLIQPPQWTQTIRNRIAINQAIWGRRTIYAIEHQKMLVSEFFLPDLPNK
jgi:chorismate--pyruvate lyase